VLTHSQRRHQQLSLSKKSQKVCVHMHLGCRCSTGRRTAVPTCAGRQVPARRPPHQRLWGPLGERGALCHGRVKHGRSCRTSSTLQNHSPDAAPATVTCSYVEAGTDGFLAGVIWYTTPPCIRQPGPRIRVLGVCDFV